MLPDGLLRTSRSCGARRRQPGRRRPQPGPGPAAGRRARAARRGLEGTGNPHRGTIVAGWGGRVVAVLVLAYPFVLRSSASAGPRRSPTTSSRSSSAGFLWSGASAAIVSAQVRRRLPSLRARALARRALAVPAATCRSPRRSAGRRRSRPGASWSLDTAGAPDRPSSTRPPSLATRRGPPALAAGQRRRPHARARADVLRRHLRASRCILAMQPAPASEYLLLEPRRQRLRRAGHRRRRPGVRRRQLSRPAADARRTRVRGCSHATRRRRPRQDDLVRRSHRGPLRAGEWVRLTDTKGRRHNICLEPGQAVLHQPRVTSTTTS